MWVHQNTVNTFVASAAEYYLPLVMSSPALSKNIMAVLPELKGICGDKCDMSFSVSPQDPSSLFAMTVAKGIEIGSEKSMFDVELWIKNSSTPKPVSVAAWTTAMALKVNFTMSNTVFYPVFKSSDFWNTKLTKSAISMGAHKYDLVLDSLTTLMGQSWNQEYKAGIPLGQLDPQLAMIGGLIKNSTISPYVADGWMYAGFDMAADAPYYHQLSTQEIEAAYPREELTQFL